MSPQGGSVDEYAELSYKYYDDSDSEVFLNERKTHERVWRDRAKRVKDAIRHSWKHFRNNLLTHGTSDFDPFQGACKDGSRHCRDWLSQKATLFDSLDTLYIAGLKDEFRDALNLIVTGTVSVTTGGRCGFFYFYFFAETNALTLLPFLSIFQ